MKSANKEDYIINPKTGEKKYIVAESSLPCEPKDLLIGAGLILGGIWHLLRKTFKNGAESYSTAEFNALNDLGLINNSTDEIDDYKRG